MIAYSLLQACVVLTKCSTCLIGVRWNFIPKCFGWNQSSTCHFFAHLCHLYTDKNDGGSGL